MRIFLSVFLLTLAPLALWAAPVELSAPVRSVTLFPQGAEVTRRVPISGAGAYLIPGLPADTDPATLRIGGPGVTISSLRLIEGRLPVSGGAEDAAIAAAREKVAALTAKLAEGEDGVAAIRARVQAAEARIAVLKAVSGSGLAPSDLPALSDAVGKGVLAAGEDALKARAEARQAEAALAPDRAALDAAKQALEALEHPKTKTETLMFEASGKGELRITAFTGKAGWSPSYDLRFDEEKGILEIDRFAVLSQHSGEDWSQVALLLSTARLTERGTPSDLPPEKISVGPEPIRPLGLRKMEAVALAAPAAEAIAAPELLGGTMTYRAPGPVDIRDGVEDLRLRLDSLSRRAKEIAEAVPLVDSVAYRVVEGANSGEEPLLPGPAVLFVGGATVGRTELPFLAAGETFSLGFGAIDGLRLSRAVTAAHQGDRGLIAKSNAREEAAKIRIDNLTGQDWPVRLIDRVPYSEQEELKVSWQADPAPTASDWQEKRGILMWRFDLAAGKSREITLETRLNWPAGQVLR